jgi:hypothetical protein
MSTLLPRVVAYSHTPQVCGLCRGVKVGIRGLLLDFGESLPGTVSRMFYERHAEKNLLNLLTFNLLTFNPNVQNKYSLHA